MTPKKSLDINIKRTHCSFDCNDAREIRSVPDCYTINPIRCEKYGQDTEKGKPCFDILIHNKRYRKKK